MPIKGTPWYKRLAHLHKMRNQAWRAPITSVALDEVLERNAAVCAALQLPEDCTTERLKAALEKAFPRALRVQHPLVDVT